MHDTVLDSVLFTFCETGALQFDTSHWSIPPPNPLFIQHVQKVKDTFARAILLDARPSSYVL